MIRKAGAAVVPMLIVAGALSAQQPVPPLTLEPTTFEVSGTPLAAEQGRLRVPADRAAGSADSLTLGLIRFRSTAANPGAPIVFLAGGPGDAGTRAVRGMPVEYLAALRGIADVIAFDQRGTGTSEPVRRTCPPGGLLPRDRPADPQGMLAELNGRVARCIEQLRQAGTDVAGLTTAESADDLDDLRRALGVPRLTLLAGSYGTHLALATVRRHPGAVDRMALLGVEGPDQTLKLPLRVDSVLGRVAAARRPGLLDDIRTLRARLSSRPAQYRFPNGHVIVLGEWDLQRWTAEALNSERGIAALLNAVPGMLGDDFEALGRWALRFRMPRPLNLMNLAMNCASFASPARLARIERERPLALAGGTIDFPLPELCGAPGLPRLPEESRGPLSSPVPALLVAGTLDGRTPVENLTELSGGLAGAETLIVPGASHDLFRHQPVMQRVLEFFRR